jgi:hypothetical protein
VANSSAGILVTSYEQLRLRRADLLAVPWGYAILDEGHKIRNPDAEVLLRMAMGAQHEPWLPSHQHSNGTPLPAQHACGVIV